MSTELELLWTAVLLLLLLGVAASLCVRCSRPGMKKPEKIYEQRSLQENQQSFAVTRTYSSARQAWPGSALDSAPDSAQTRKDKLLQFSPGVEGSASPRYQNFSKGSRQESDAAYIDPITVDYYNWEPFQKPLEEEDDSCSYQNVLICRPGSATEPGETTALRITRTQHPSSSGRSPGGLWSLPGEKHLLPRQEAVSRIM
ncbi:linker for activation of T-cells family member 2 isoform X2 [Elephas maximus indicus]|uniref:linker for activation of T-cells family member 2 isoform X2 n=1 Tax=Elephas maximus indicus TaxID=99487 RepID=UPI00211677FF|nr:linker for activation of T-cells family member 2 isoform X2 [Elephas maximus indicus]